DPPDRSQYKQVPDTKRYGTLRGLWVKKEIHDDLVNSAAPEWRDEQLQWAHNQWRRAVSWWKASKTSLNVPAGHIRNHVSGSFQAQLFGQVPVHRLPDLYLSTMRDIARNGAGWQAAKRHGVRSTSFAQAELMKIHDEFKLKLGLKHYKHNPTRLVIEAASRLVNAAGDAYSANEQFWKTLVMKYHMGRGMPEAEAAELAHTAIFDYSLVPNWLRALRENLPFGAPFATFMYKALPLSLEAMFKRPWAYWPYAAMIWGTFAALSHYQDLDDEDIASLKELLPEWLGHTQTVILPFKDQHGRWLPVDLSYFFPFGGWLKAAGHLGDGQVIDALGEIGLGGHPGMNIPASLKHNRDGLGRPIWEEGDPAAEQALDIFAFLAAQGLPPQFAPGGSLNQLYDAIQGIPDRYGNPQRTPAEAASRVMGFTTQPMDTEVARMRGAWQRVSKIRDAEQRAREIARDRSLSEDQKRQMLERQLAHIRKLAQELKEWQAKVARAPK
ncbi:MAG TPA: hypothetical protein VFO09_05065, partial [Methyloceanibacter sp.]|nr:hypothetical protein [Methyloceanibacter sp.]